MEQYLQEPAAENFNQDEVSLTKWKSASPPEYEPENSPPGGMDCNICLDLVQDPVVTFCGHLYCWPCIYKWIHFQSVPSEDTDPQLPQCPVCKAEVSQETLIPLYGRGLTSTKSSKGKAPQFGIVIPQRPLSPRCGAHLGTVSTAARGSHPLRQIHHRNHSQQRQQYHYPHPGGYMDSPPTLNLGGTTTNVFHPAMGMFGEMVYARIFGNSATTLYTYPNSYHMVGSTTPRLRRHVMQADKSLGRVCFFLCCCMILCLLLF